MKNKTDSSPPEAPKATAGSLIFDLYKEWARPEEITALADRYAAGIGWGHAKEALYEVINREITPAREKYLALMKDPQKIDHILAQGAERARQRAREVLGRVRKAIGIQNHI
jgi:tryptophanyl-tRNA synthetase